MRWVKAARPDLYERTETFLEPVDYISARFTGRRTASQCTSFMQMLADNRKVPNAGWHPDLVRASMIDRSKLPEPVATGEVIGTVLPDIAAKLGIPSNAEVLSGINDTQAGAVAAGAFRGDHAGLAVGTTAVIVTVLATSRRRCGADPAVVPACGTGPSPAAVSSGDAT